MDPNKKTKTNPEVERYTEKFGKLRTIPSGWEVSAFYDGEREDSSRYCRKHNTNHTEEESAASYDDSRENTL